MPRASFAPHPPPPLARRPDPDHPDPRPASSACSSGSRAINTTRPTHRIEQDVTNAVWRTKASSRRGAALLVALPALEPGPPDTPQTLLPPGFGDSRTCRRRRPPPGGRTPAQPSPGAAPPSSRNARRRHRAIGEAPPATRLPPPSEESASRTTICPSELDQVAATQPAAAAEQLFQRAARPAAPDRRGRAARARQLSALAPMPSADATARYLPR